MANRKKEVYKVGTMTEGNVSGLNSNLRNSLERGMTIGIYSSGHRDLEKSEKSMPGMYAHYEAYPD